MKIFVSGCLFLLGMFVTGNVSSQPIDQEISQQVREGKQEGQNLENLAELPQQPNENTAVNSVKIEFGTSGIDYKKNAVKLYNFSDELLTAVKSCLPYQEDFTKNNPDLAQLGSFFGGIDFKVMVDIKGMNDNMCHFIISQKLQGIQNINFDCQVSKEQLNEIYAAMQDRSKQLVTETFTTYSEVERKDGSIEKFPVNTTMTDGRFNIVLAKLQKSACKVTENKATAEEKQAAGENMDTFSDIFLNSLQNCEPYKENKQFLIINEKVEILGKQGEKCHLKYQGFDLLLPSHLWTEVTKFSDLKNLLKDKTVSRYTPQYDLNGLVSQLSDCAQQKRNGRLSGTRKSTFGSLEKEESFSVSSDAGDCVVEVGHILSIDGQKTDYSKVCRVPTYRVLSILEELQLQVDDAEDDSENYSVAERQKKLKAVAANEELLFSKLEELGYCQ